MPRYPVPEGLQASPGVLALFEAIGPRYRWWVVVTSMLGTFATLLTSTIVNVAIPDIMGALGITLDQAQWLSTAFLAAGTVTMLLTDWSMRAFGVRATFVVAMLVFLGGSVLGGVAPNADVLFLARVIQGGASGVMMPISTVLISQVFPLSQRGRAMGLRSVGTVLAPALGPTLGGLLVDHLSWRWVFFMAVPFALIVLPMAQLFLPAREEQGARPPFDWTGVALCGLYLALLLIGLSQAQREGFDDDFVTLTLAGALVTFAAWIGWELRAPAPMLDLRLFLIPKFAAAAVVTLTVGVGLYGSTYLLPLFLQTVVGMVPTDSGLLLAPAGLAMAFMFPVAGWFADITSARRMILIGLGLFALSMYPMAAADTGTPFVAMMLWYMVGRVGLALVFPALTSASLQPLTLAQLAQGAGITSFLRQLGGAIGVNALTFVLQQRIAFYTSDFFTDVRWDNAAAFESIRLYLQEYTRLGMSGYRAFELSFSQLFGSVAREALMMAYRDSFLVVMAVFVLTMLPAWFIDTSRRGGAAPAARAAITPAAAD